MYVRVGHGISEEEKVAGYSLFTIFLNK